MNTDTRRILDIASVDYKRLLDALGLVNERGRYWCPFCQNDGKPHSTPDFSFRGGGRCFRCGWKGGAASLVMELRNETFPAAVETIARALGLASGGLERSHASALRRQAMRPKERPALTFPSLDDACSFLTSDRLKGFIRAGVWHYNPDLCQVRFQKDAVKEYRPMHRKDGTWRIGAGPKPWPLYNLPGITRHSVRPVFIVEGEKCAQAGMDIGLCCTTSMQGAGSSKNTDWQPLVCSTRPKRILPDNDRAGEKYAGEVRDLVGGRVVILPGLGAGEDLADFIEQHGDRARLMVERLAR